LKVKSKYTTWVQRRISDYGFKENIDYISTSQKRNVEKFNNLQPTAKEYHATLDMAKEICMVEKNARGREARRYFINCEKQAKLKQSTLPPQIARYLRQNKTVPIGYFIPLEIVTLELTVKLSEQGVDLLKDMLPEGSFVRSWNKHLRTNLNQNIESFPTHPVTMEWGYNTHERCYPLELRLDATQHFWGSWLPGRAPKYLESRVNGATSTLPKAIPDLERRVAQLGGNGQVPLLG
jgi:phage anti-repressor protein